MSLMSVKSYFGGLDGRVWLTKPLFSSALFKGIKANSVPLLLLLSLFLAFITSASPPSCLQLWTGFHLYAQE